MKGVSVLFDSQFDDGWRSDMDIMLIATWDGTKHEIYTDIGGLFKISNCTMHDIGDFDYNTCHELAGYNLHGEFKDSSFDILKEVKRASADILQNEGKRFNLYDLARWNRCQTTLSVISGHIHRYLLFKRGGYTKVIRWAMADAKLCFDLYHKVKKEKRVKFFDIKTGKHPFAEVSWGIGDEGGEEE